MIKRKKITNEARRGIYCPVRYEGEGRCMGQACAWWVDEDEERGHCAVLDVRRETDGKRD